MGGVSKLGSGVFSGEISGVVSGALGKLIKNPKVVQTISKYIASMGAEATEEYLQSVLEPLFRNIAADENNDINLLSPDALYAAMLGALTGGMFTGHRFHRRHT